MQTQDMSFGVSEYPPPFKLTPDLCTQPYRLIGKQRVNLELTE